MTILELLGLRVESVYGKLTPPQLMILQTQKERNLLTKANLIPQRRNRKKFEETDWSED